MSSAVPSIVPATLLNAVNAAKILSQAFSSAGVIAVSKVAQNPCSKVVEG